MGEERGSGIQTRSPITLCFFCPMSHSGLAHTKTHTGHVSMDKGNSSGRMGSRETHEVVREDRDGGRERGYRD